MKSHARPRAAAVSGMHRRLLGRFILAWLLLWAQQSALVHPYSHLHQATAKASRSLLPELACTDCHAHAPLFSALNNRALTFVPELPTIDSLCLPSAGTRSPVTVCAFQARAPPFA